MNNGLFSRSRGYSVSYIVTFFAFLATAVGLYSFRSCSAPLKKKCIAPNFSANIANLKGKKNLVPVLILGSGPAGLSAAIYTSREVPTVVLHGGKPGGLLTDTSLVENWPGERSILGSDLIGKLQQQAEAFGARFVEDSVTSVDFSQWPFVLKTADQTTLHALTVIICTGAKPKMLGIPGEEKYWASGVTSCAVCDAPFFKNEDVVVIGGGDSAVEEATQLARHVKSVTILVRGDRMRAAGAMQGRLSGYPNVSTRYGVEPREIVGDGARVTGIEVFDKNKQALEIIPITGVFLAIGHQPNTQLFTESLTLDNGGYIEIGCHCQETSVSGVYAAGDVADPTYRQAGVAAGDGIKAALDSLAFLRSVGFDSVVMNNIQKDLFAQPSVPVLDKEVEKSSEKKNNLGNIEIVASLVDLDQLVQEAQLPVIIDFFTEDCTACKRVLPLLENAAKTYAGKAIFVKVDAGEAEGVMEKYQVTRVPTLLIYDRGALRARHNSALEKRELNEFLQAVIEG